MHTHTDLKTRKGWSREVHTYTLETQKGHTAILFRLPVPQFLHQSNRLMMGVFHINEKRLIRWCWQSHVEFPGQKRSIVETCQMCRVKKAAALLTPKEWKHYDENTYSSQKASFEMKTIHGWGMFITVPFPIHLQAIIEWAPRGRPNPHHVLGLLWWC